MTAIALAVLVSLFHADSTNRYVEIEDSKIYWDEPALGIDAVEVNMIKELQKPVDFSTVNFDCVTASGIQATLVAPDIAIGCAHYTYSVGQNITFGDETAIVTEVIKYAYVLLDYSFIRLDRELSVQPATLAHAKWYDWIEWDYSLRIYEEGITACVIDQFGEPVKTTIWNRSGATKTERPLVTYDSGSPVFLFFNARPVLLYVVTRSDGLGSRIAEDLMPVKRGWIRN